MRIDELIEELQKVRSEHGNIEVLFTNMDGENDYETTGVWVRNIYKKCYLTRDEAINQGLNEEYVKRIYDQYGAQLEDICKTGEKIAIIE